MPDAIAKAILVKLGHRRELDAMIRYLETHMRYEVMGDGGWVSVGLNRTVVASPRLHSLRLAADEEPHRWNSGDATESSEPAAPREPGNDRCQVVWVDGLWHVDLEPSQQRQACVVFLDERR